MNILLIVPSAKTFYGKPRYPVLGIAMIGAVLLQAGHTVHALDLRLHPDNDDVLRQALTQWEPDMVGFTVTNWDFLNALHHARLVKIFNKSIITVFGGPQPSLCPQETISSELVDIVVTGEGEITVVELVDHLARSASLDPVSGILFRREDGTVHDTGPRPLIEDLSPLPRPAFELFELDAYKAGKEKRLGIYTTRGCPYGCIFCTGKTLMGRRIRSRPAADVVEEMRYWHQTAGITHFCFLEDNCFGKTTHGRELLEHIETARLPVTYSLEVGVRADALDDTICNKLRHTGCTMIAIGIESVDPEVLTLSQKGETIEQITNGIRAAKRAGLFVKGYFIVGLPGDSTDKVKQAVKFADAESIDMPRFALAQAFPNTPLEQWVREHGHFYIEPYDYILHHTDEFHGAVHYDFPGFSRDAIWKMYQWAHDQAEAISFRQALKRTFGNKVGGIMNILNIAIIRKLIIKLYQTRLISLPK